MGGFFDMFMSLKGFNLQLGEEDVLDVEEVQCVDFKYLVYYYNNINLNLRLFLFLILWNNY